MRMNRKGALVAGAMLGVAFLAACSDSPTAPTANVVVPKSNFAVGGVTPTATPQIGKVFVCKSGNVGGAFSFGRTTVGPSPDPAGAVAANQTIATGSCLEVANDFSPSGSGSNITVTEAAAANTVQTVASCVFIGKDLLGNVQPPVSCSFANGGTLFINNFHGFVITYNNVFTPPPTGNQGCTPGFWKQDQHFDSWKTALSTTFAQAGMNFGFVGTLLSGLQAGGGGVNALARHAAAAYLNSLAGSGVNFKYTTAQVVAIANGTGAFAGLTIEERKDLLEAANTNVGGCPLS